MSRPQIFSLFVFSRFIRYATTSKVDEHLYSPVAETRYTSKVRPTHTSKLKYSKTHEEVIKRNKNCQSVQLRFKMNIDIAKRITRINRCHAAVAQAACGQ